jgi:hypothetical protein
LPEQVRQHPTISRYRNEIIRFKTVHAGRRSYKTEIAKRTLVIEGSGHTGQRLFFGAPTRDQAKQIAWNDLKLLALPLTVDKSETELFIKLATGSEIWIIGFDKPERFEGRIWHGGILDEFPELKEKVWPESVRPALTDTNGWCWLIGVPAGKNHYYELVERARSKKDKEWEDYNWLSADVLPSDEIEKLKESYDERTYRQEFEGSFESYEGRAYIYYDADMHRKPQTYSPYMPVCVSCDFNLDPCIWILGQDFNGFVSIQDEIKQGQTDIWKMCATLKERLEKRVGRECRKKLTIFYGDLEHGKTRSVSATASSWEIIRSEFIQWNIEFRLRGHPRIIDRVNAVNAKLRNVKGEPKLGLDPICRELHKDMEMVSLEMLQNESTKTPKDRTHASDDLGYWINYDYPIAKHGGTIVEGA